MHGQESVPSVLEADARGEIAEIYADIRKVLGTSVVNLIWRNLATMPGALPWTWATVRLSNFTLPSVRLYVRNSPSLLHLQR